MSHNARCARGGHFVTRIGLRVALALLATYVNADQREAHAERHTSHEVTAARAGRFSAFQ